MSFLEIQFSLRGKTLPADHGYALYATVKKLLQQHQPDLLEDQNLPAEWLLSSIPGIPDFNGIIYLNQRSRFRLRCPGDSAPQLYRLLQNQVLDIRGHLVRLIQPRLTLPETSETLKARLVVFHLEQWKSQEAPQYFLESCQKALADQEIRGKAFIDSNHQGDLALRGIKIAGKNVLGYGVVIEGLNPEDSLKLQGSGLGGRKHFGCGWFYPIEEENNAA
ncbi:type I-MYXAN CRISPR-associated protein Cas6/Cmx6 [Gloeocapsa sp. PCC 73106]|uniref:type I-MYXAN CRISPR-associated protein Cas6/Cmx6 n=1 Tax=Gloeocapsa sp. PCC 73106 TaxID=102232 RepID=UPI0002AC959A|nr:type I-MYXAN CRISPR-associated protein Cas6/Cmx6 [Gloeocapsa sp. PCC 73106]ELR97557.1 CRISPR-associated protein Cas6, subtype MYXAN [Gloeocapsa sp. PCC 73106]